MLKINSQFVFIRSVSRQVNFKSRKTAKICGNCVLPRQSWRYDAALGRHFQKSFGKKLGFDLGLEAKLILASMGQRHRRLDDKKMKQLSEVLSAKFEEVVACDEKLGDLAIQFDKVKVNSSFTELSIYWICNGKNDDQVRKVLEEQKYSIRKSLSDSVGTSCPEIKFVPDKSQLLVEEMNKLFEKADYGVDYRTLKLNQKDET